MSLMTETIASPSVAKPVSRLGSRKTATVSASALALHLDCSRAYIGRLEVEGVISGTATILATREAAIAAQ
jgi:hypothetical protein